MRAVAAGQGFLDPAVTARILTAYRRTGAPTRPNTALENVTPREIDVLTLIGKGRTNGEIAHELGISALTVKTHIGRIFTKLGLRDRASAIVFAYDHRLVSSP